MVSRLFSWRWTLAFLLSTLLSSVHIVGGYQWPSPQYDDLERLLYEGTRTDGIDLFGLLKNCGPNFPKLPEQTTVAATWLRLAFHDAATFNATTKTGGVDGSIHFELDRTENVGDGLKTAQVDYSIFPDKYISKADIIAIGAAFAVAGCGGPIIPVRGGRIDAEGPGPKGVSEPDQDLETHIKQFKSQGFTEQEMIELVACGHTIGGVESKDFPTVVSAPTNANLSSRSVPFDTTTSFDTVIVDQYLNGSTQNPLIVAKNETMRSDLRIFSSDGNTTMKALSDRTVFRTRCADVFEKMLNNVPSGVQLTEPIDVIPAKPQHAGLRIFQGQLTFYAVLRLARPSSDPFADASSVSLYWCDRYGVAANCTSGVANVIHGATMSQNSQTHSPLMTANGLNFRYYYFQAPIDPARSVSEFWWTLDGSHQGGSLSIFDNNGAKYLLDQDQIFHPTALTQLLDAERLANSTSNDTAPPFRSRCKGLEPSRVYGDFFDKSHLDVPVGTTMNTTIQFVRNTTIPSVPGYKLYSAQFDLIGWAPTMDLHVEVDGAVSTVDLQALGAPNDPPYDKHTLVALGLVQQEPISPAVSTGGGVHSLASSPALSMLSFLWLGSLCYFTQYY